MTVTDNWGDRMRKAEERNRRNERIMTWFTRFYVVFIVCTLVFFWWNMPDIPSVKYYVP